MYQNKTDYAYAWKFTLFISFYRFSITLQKIRAETQEQILCTKYMVVWRAKSYKNRYIPSSKVENPQAKYLMILNVFRAVPLFLSDVTKLRRPAILKQLISHAVHAFKPKSWHHGAPGL